GDLLLINKLRSSVEGGARYSGCRPCPNCGLATFTVEGATTTPVRKPHPNPLLGKEREQEMPGIVVVGDMPTPGCGHGTREIGPGNLTPSLSLERRGSKKCRALLSQATCPPRAVGMAAEKSGQETSPQPSPWKGEGARVPDIVVVGDGLTPGA